MCTTATFAVVMRFYDINDIGGSGIRLEFPFLRRHFFLFFCFSLIDDC